MVFLFVLLILIIILLFSKIVIKVDDLQISSKRAENSYLNNNYNIKIKLIILKFIPIAWFNINNKKVEKLKANKKINFSNRKLLNKIAKKIVKLIKIKRFYLKLNISSDFPIITSIIVLIFSTVISILLIKNKVKEENAYYKINSNYNLGNLLKIKFCGIFELKMIHIINVMCKGE